MSESERENVVPEAEMARRRRVNELLEDISDLTNDLTERVKDLSGIVNDESELFDLVSQSVGDHRFGAVLSNMMPIFQNYLGKMVSNMIAGNPPRNKFEEGLVGFLAKLGGHIGEAASKIRDVREDIADDDDDDEVPLGSYLVTPSEQRKKALILRLFEEAPKLESPDGTPDISQAPAIECHVLLRGAPSAVHGSLSVTKEGMLRMLTPATRESTRHGRKVEIPILCEQFFDVADVVSIMLERAVAADTGSIITSA